MAQGNDSDFSHSLTDMMASIAVVFLLIAAAAIFLIHEKAVASVDRKRTHIKAEKDKLFREIADLLKMERGADSPALLTGECAKLDNREPFRLKVSFINDPEKCLGRSLSFDSGESLLPAANIGFAQGTVTDIFKRVCASYKGAATPSGRSNSPELIHAIQLIGHTDDQRLPVGRAGFEGCGVQYAGLSTDQIRTRNGFCNNVQLSTRRAQSVFYVVRTVLQDGSEEDKSLVRDCMDHKFTVAGKGPTEPVPDAPAWQGEESGVVYTDEQRRQNRRVELIIEYKQPSSLSR